MRSIIFVLVSLVLVEHGCAQPATRAKASPRGAVCRPDNAVCIVKVGDASLIRSSGFWLLDLQRGHAVDGAALGAAAQMCDGPTGCGVAMTRPEIDALLGRLAKSQGRKMTIDGEPVSTFQRDQNVVVQIWGAPAKFAQVARLITPTMILVGGVQCEPAECEGPPPPPPPRSEPFTGPHPLGQEERFPHPLIVPRDQPLPPPPPREPDLGPRW